MKKVAGKNEKEEEGHEYKTNCEDSEQLPRVYHSAGGLISESCTRPEPASLHWAIDFLWQISHLAY